MSQDDLLDVPCDEDDLHDDIYVIPMQSLKNDHAICVLKSNTCAKNRLVIHNASKVDELKLSLNRPIYKSTSTKTIAETIKFSNLSPYKPGSQLKSRRISNQLAYNLDHSNST